MQSVPTKDVFEKDVSLFFIKWAEKGQEIDTFLEYFCMQKIERNSGWFEAIKGDNWCPTTTNGIECNNRLVKENHTFRERWPLGRFCCKTTEITEGWSFDRNT